MGTSAERFRDQFPSLADTVHLASCSQGAASLRLIAALQEFTWSMRSQGAPWERWSAEVDAARAAFAGYVGSAGDDVAVVPSASEAAYQVASTQDYSRRPTIVTTDMEFPSVAHVWLAQRARGAEVRHVPDRDGVVLAEDYLAAIDERTALVSIPLVSYRNGLRMPVAEVTKAAREAGSRVFVDAYQAVGVTPVRMPDLGCDYLACGALKYMLGVPGIAFLAVRPGLLDAVPPQLTGWFGRVDPYAFDPRTLDFPATARRFEIGTAAVPAAYGARAGLDTLAALDPVEVREHVRSLVDLTTERLLAAGETLWSPPDPALRGPMVALVDGSPIELAGYLAARRIVTSPRGHVLRISFHYYNDVSDVDAFCAALAEYRLSG